jgi:NAD(P)-dependent dehydrogenase (short-subunit alcohol dehydrogenase family)
MGRATCEAFAGPGVQVYFNFTSPETAGHATAEEISAAGGMPCCMRVNANYITGQVIHVSGGMYI